MIGIPLALVLSNATEWVRSVIANVWTSSGVNHRASTVEPPVASMTRTTVGEVTVAR